LIVIAVQVLADDYRTDSELFGGPIYPINVLEDGIPYSAVIILIPGKTISEYAG
jgi:hypothetical protein